MKKKPGKASELHKPAPHIEEVARLASSVEPDKNPENVRRAVTVRKPPPPEEDLGGGDCSLEWKPPTDDDKPLD